MEIQFTTRIFKEGRSFVAQALELDVSSCGGSKEKALRNLKEAVRLFMEEATQQLDDAELASTLGKRYPERVQIKSRLADIGTAIQKEISHLLAALQQKVIQAQTRQKALQDRLDDLRTRTAEAGTMCGGSKPLGNSTFFINAIRPIVQARPIKPLNSVRNAPSTKN